MTKKENVAGFTKKDAAKSAAWFFMHFVIFIGIAITLLFAGNYSRFVEAVKIDTGNYLYALFSIALLFIIAYLYFYFEDHAVLKKGGSIALVFTVLDVYLAMSCLIGYNFAIYARPVALVGLLILVLVDRKSAIFMNVFCTLCIFVIDTFGANQVTEIEAYSSLVIAFCAGMFAIFMCGKARTRFSVILIGVLIVVPMDIIVLLLELSGILESNGNFDKVLTQLGYGLFGGLTSTIFFLTLLPVFELAFNRLTVFRLRELTSSDAKLLKKLKQQAPGTYNHCMMVAQLAEECAAAIGENMDYARAAAMYHDVGKMQYPEHFTENQGDYNVHDELTPELSADIIRSHARDGYKLLKAQHLPDFLADVAVEHHGTMPIRYFYAKALKMTDGDLNIEDFSYVGPKPQSKIAAIIMICDAAEAAVRATGARSPEETEKVVRGVIEERMDLEQFAECDITMVELTKIRLALVSALSGVYHHRIQYPGIKYHRTENGVKGANNG